MEPDKTKESKIELLLGKNKDLSSLLESAIRGRAHRQKKENLSWYEVREKELFEERLKYNTSYSPGKRGPKGSKEEKEEEKISDKEQRIIKLRKIEEDIREKKLELALLENKLKNMKEASKKHKRRKLNI